MSGEFWDYARILISPSDPVARALTAIDWAVKMIYVLRYLDEKAQSLTRCSTLGFGRLGRYLSIDSGKRWQ